MQHVRASGAAAHLSLGLPWLLTGKYRDGFGCLKLNIEILMALNKDSDIDG